MTGQPEPPDLPPRARAALAVFAHSDDETFGLGAVLDALVDAGTAVEGLCFTRGEASTLRPDVDNPGQLCDLGDLGAVRAVELADAARLLGLEHCELLIYPDGRLAETPSPFSPPTCSGPPSADEPTCSRCSITGASPATPTTSTPPAPSSPPRPTSTAACSPGRCPNPSPPRSTPSWAPTTGAAPLPRSTSPSPSTATANAAPSPATTASPPTTPRCADALSSPARPNRSAGSADPAIPVIPAVPVGTGERDERSQPEVHPALEGGGPPRAGCPARPGRQVARDVMAVVVM